MTGERGGKADKVSIDKKPLNSDEKLRRKINVLLRKRYFERNIVNEKPPNPGRVLGGKPTPYN